MSSGKPALSTSSRDLSPAQAWQVIVGTAATVLRTRVMGMGVTGYILTWMTFPLMQMAVLAFIYKDNRELLDYAVVAGAGSGILFGLIYNAGEILDDERGRGTLGNLFLAPMPRFVWLSGFQLVALIESVVTATIAVSFGAWWFGLDLHVNLATILITLVLLVASLWGISLILGSLGLMMRNANFLSNLIFPFFTLLAGTMYPIARMPDWIRIPARALPFGYGMDALVAGLTKHASPGDVWRDIVALAAFAIVLPILGIWMFRVMERAVRSIGSLEIT